MLSILIELIRALRIICTDIKLRLARLLKAIFDAFIDCYSLHDFNKDENKQYFSDTSLFSHLTFEILKDFEFEINYIFLILTFINFITI